MLPARGGGVSAFVCRAFLVRMPLTTPGVERCPGFPLGLDSRVGDAHHFALLPLRRRLFLA